MAARLLGISRWLALSGVQLWSVGLSCTGLSVVVASAVGSDDKRQFDYKCGVLKYASGGNEWASVAFAVLEFDNKFPFNRIHLNCSVLLVFIFFECLFLLILFVISCFFFVVTFRIQPSKYNASFFVRFGLRLIRRHLFYILLIIFMPWTGYMKFAMKFVGPSRKHPWSYRTYT